jgi:hypothetical protein
VLPSRLRNRWPREPAQLDSRRGRISQRRARGESHAVPRYDVPPNGPKDYYSTAPAPPKARHVVTEALRSKLLVSTWLTLALPPRDYLLGDVLCSTSRWLIFGETGIGKTLAAMDLGAAVSAG